MKFLALNMLQILGHAVSSGRQLSPQQRGQLLEGLAQIEQVAGRLRKVKAARSLSPRQASDHNTLQSLWSLDGPRTVYLLEPGWFEELRKCVEHDRQLLILDDGRQLRTPALEELQAACRRRANFASRWREQAARRSPLLTQELLDRYREPADIAPHERWNSHFAAMVERQFQRCALPGLALLHVDVREAERGGARSDGDVVHAEAREWSLRDSGRRGLRVDVDVRAASMSRRSLSAEIFIELRGVPTHRALAPGKSWNGASTKHVWERLVHGEPSSPAFLECVAAALRRLALTPRHRPWAEVWKDAQAVASPGVRCDTPCLLAELAFHSREIAMLARSEKLKLLEAVPNIVSASNWPAVREYVADVVAAFEASATRLEGVYRAVADRAPAEPERDELAWLLRVAERWRIDLHAAGPLVLALGEMDRRHAQAPALRIGELLRGLLRERPATLEDQRLEPLWDSLERFVRDAPDESLAVAIRELSGPLAAARAGGIARDNVAAFLDRCVCRRLGALVPCPDPGVWQTADQHPSFLGALEAFEELVSALGLGGWDTQTLDTARELLPRLPGESTPSRYPSCFWMLIRVWLCRDVPEWGTYTLEVATWLIERYLSFGDFGRPDLSPACLVPVEEQLRRLGEWLRRRGTPHRAYEILVATILAHASRPATDPSRTGRLIALLSCPPDGDLPLVIAQSDCLEEVAARLFALQPWRHGLGDAFRQILVHGLATSGDIPWNETAGLGTLGLVRAGPSEIGNWSAFLKKFVPDPSWHLDVVDACLSEWDAALRRGRPVELMAEQLEALAGWLRGGHRTRDLYTRWQSWLRRWDQESAGLGAASPFPRGAQLLVLSACLRSDHNLAGERLLQLWPTLSGWLLVQGKYRLFRQLVGLSQRCGVEFTPTMANALASEVAPVLESRFQRNAADGAVWALKIVRAWARRLRRDGGPQALIRMLWPSLPSGLITGCDQEKADRFREICQKCKVAWTEAMQIGLAAQVLLAVSPNESGARIAAHLELLKDFADPIRSALWDRIAPLPVGHRDYLKEHVVAIAVTLFCTPANHLERMFREEVWRQANAHRTTNPVLAGTLASLALDSTSAPSSNGQLKRAAPRTAGEDILIIR
jgi:hypothetical protein